MSADNDAPRISVAYQGVEGSYSSIAVSERFPDAERTGYPTFDDVVRVVQSGEADYALLPIENSTAGRVADIHHLLPGSGLCIIDEYFLPIHHALIGLKDARVEDITHVYSHREALSQCVAHIRELGATAVPYGDTAGAAAFVAEEGNPAYGALASAHAAALHPETTVLREHMEDDASNVTRFLVLARNAQQPPSADRPESGVITSIVYNVLDTPAALYHALGAFARHNINIIKLESFVPMVRHRDAHFYLEFEGNPAAEEVAAALTELKNYTKELEVLGTYAANAYRKNFKGQEGS